MPKPCQFCGYTDVAVRSDGYSYGVICPNCRAHGPLAELDESAIDLWDAADKSECLEMKLGRAVLQKLMDFRKGVSKPQDLPEYLVAIVRDFFKDPVSSRPPVQEVCDRCKVTPYANCDCQKAPDPTPIPPTLVTHLGIPS